MKERNGRGNIWKTISQQTRATDAIFLQLSSQADTGALIDC
jgi:hypothetical protein